LSAVRRRRRRRSSGGVEDDDDDDDDGDDDDEDEEVKEAVRSVRSFIVLWDVLVRLLLLGPVLRLSIE